MRAVQKQLVFPNGHGGNRKYGWARKQRRMGRRDSPPHRVRRGVHRRFPVHVTMRLDDCFPNLRRPPEHRVVKTSIWRGNWKEGYRVNHYCIQSNHVHLIVEADDRVALARGMQGLATRMAKALNKLWDRSGRVFAQRYHSVVLRTASQVRNALRYVLNNVLHHGGSLRFGRPDPCSSGEWFDGWRDCRPRSPDDGYCPVIPARTALQRFVWRRLGLIPLLDPPRGAR